MRFMGTVIICARSPYDSHVLLQTSQHLYKFVYFWEGNVAGSR
jgi:hypothetical protein